MPTILMCYVLTPLLERWFGRIDHKPAFLLAEMLLIFATVFGFFYTYFNPAWISCYLIGYFLGYCLSRGLQRDYYLVTVISGIFSLMNIVQIFMDYVLKIKFVGKIQTLYNYWRNYNHVWLGIIIFIVLKWLFDRYSDYPLWFKKITTVLDKYSYEGYLVHQFIILGPMTLMDLTASVAVNIIIILILVAIMSYIVKKLRIMIMKIYSI